MSRLKVGTLTAAITGAMAAVNMTRIVTQSTIHFYKLKISDAMYLNRFEAMIAKTVAGSVFRIGIYGNDNDLGIAQATFPTALFFETGDIAGSVGNGGETLGLPFPVLEPGEYWIAVWAKVGSPEFKAIHEAACPNFGGLTDPITYYTLVYGEEGEVDLPLEVANQFITNASAEPGRIVKVGLTFQYVI